jgi:hypothetical protein
MRSVPHMQLTPTDKGITITADDRDNEVGGNMSHEYTITIGTTEPTPGVVVPVAQTIHFQRGPVAEVGVNGLTNEALIAIVIDRLEGAQEGPFRSRYNALAITSLQEAENWLSRRTFDRMARGVEGQSKQ